MAEKKIVEVEATKKENKKSLNIDTTELKKIGAAIMSFVVSNPEIVSKLLEKPASYLKKIVNKEDVSKTTKKKVNSVIDANKSGGITSILTSLSSLSNDNDTTDIFKKLSGSLSGSNTSDSLSSILSGVGSLLGSTNTKTTKKKTSDTSNILGNLFKGLFK